MSSTQNNVTKRELGKGNNSNSRSMSSSTNAWRPAIRIPLVGAAVLAAVAASGFTRSKYIFLLPIVCITCLFATIYTCYVMWFPTRDDVNIIFPALSQLGVNRPEKYVYQLGFTTVGFLLAFHVYVLAENVAPLLEDINGGNKKDTEDFIKFAYRAAFGAALQGIFTLEPRISFQSIVHWIGAFLFMHAAVSHAQLSVELFASYFRRRPGSFNAALRWSVWIRQMILNMSSIVMFAPIVLSQIYVAFARSTGEADVAKRDLPKSAPANVDLATSATMNAMGLMQWLIVLQFSMFFASYSLDLYSLEETATRGWSIGGEE